MKRRSSKHHTLLPLLIFLCLASQPPSVVSAATNGPLRVDASITERYFVDAADQPVYLSGFHTWDSVQDWTSAITFDSAAYQSDLNGSLFNNYPLNFARLWIWEGTSNGARGDCPLHATDCRQGQDFTPLPWSRPNQFDLVDANGNPNFVDAYFERLYDRVRDARDEDIYVSVMLFQGWSVIARNVTGLGNFEPWLDHPFNPDNHSDALGCGNQQNGDFLHQLPPSGCAAVLGLQEDLVREVLDTLNGGLAGTRGVALDNVLLEIANESRNSLPWQEHIQSIAEGHMAAQNYLDYPVGITFISDHTNLELFQSTASFISPQQTGSDDYSSDPPSNISRNGSDSKVILNDTDHLAGPGGVLGSEDEEDYEVWAWTSATRGLNPILMDAYQHPFYADLPDAAGVPAVQTARRYLRDAKSYIDRVDLGSASPSSADCDDGFCLIDPGVTYLVYSKAGGGSFEVNVEAGDYRREWFNPEAGNLNSVAFPTIAGPRNFNPPQGFTSGAVLFLERLDTATPPTASFTTDPTPAVGTAPLAIDFDANGSTDPDGTIENYAWDFGDNQTGTGVSPSHTFAAGTYTVTLTVTDNDSLTDSVTVVVEAIAPETSLALLRDSFERNVAGGMPGRLTEVGSVPWASSGVILGNNGGLKAVVGNSGWAHVPVDVSPGEVLVVSADIKPFTSGPSDFNAIGFATNNTQGLTSSNNQVSIRLDDEGNYAVRYDGTKGPLSPGTLDNFNVLLEHRVELAYDPLSNEIWATIDGEPSGRTHGLGQGHAILRAAGRLREPPHGRRKRLRYSRARLRSPHQPVTTARQLWQGQSSASPHRLDDRAGGSQLGHAAGNAKRQKDGVLADLGANSKSFVPLPETDSEVFTLLADISPHTANDEWNAVGFSESASGGLSGVNGELWLQLDNAGNYHLRYDGLSVITNGNVTLTVTDQNRAELSYDPLTNKVRLALNGELLQPWVDLDDPIVANGFVPDIHYGAIQMKVGTGFGIRIHDFEVRSNPAILRDSFSTNPGPLDGRSTETGGQAWVATTGVEIVTEGLEVTAPTDPRAFVSTSGAEDDQPLRLVATLVPPTDGWTGAGFTTDDSGGLAGTNGQIWVQLESSGQYKVRVAGNGFVENGTLASVGATTEARIEVLFDPLTNEATAWINEIVVYERTNLEDLGTPLTADIKYAACDLRTDSAGPLVLDLELQH